MPKSNLAPHLELVRGSDDAHERRVRGVHPTVRCVQPTREAEDVPETSLELCDEASELFVHATVLAVAEKRAINAVELVVQRADGGVRHGRHRDVSGNVADAQSSSLELREHDLARRGRIEAHDVGRDELPARERRLKDHRRLVVQERAHRAVRIQHQLRGELIA